MARQGIRHQLKSMINCARKGGGEKCTICQKSVYAAERVEAGQNPYHKFCFKCSVDGCKIQLTINNYAQAHGILYCKKHYNERVVAQNTQPKMA